MRNLIVVVALSMIPSPTVAADLPPQEPGPAPLSGDDAPAHRNAGQQVVFRIRMIEASLTKCRQLGFSLNLTGNVCTVVAGEAQTDFIDFLLEHDLAKVLADPTIVTVPGRPAEFFVGGGIPIGAAAAGGPGTYVEVGTRATIGDLSVTGDRIRAEILVRVTTLDDARKVETEAQTLPAIQRREIDTGIEVTSGETVMMAGLRTRAAAGNAKVGDAKEETALVLLVTPECVEPVAQVKR